jgi:hypothetical protein
MLFPYINILQKIKYFLKVFVCPFQGETCPAELGELATKGFKSLSAKAVSPFKKGEQGNPQSFGQPLSVKGHRKTVLFIL